MYRKLSSLLLGALFSFVASASADGLHDYVSKLGPAADIAVTERSSHGPTRISFQSQMWRGIPWKHELLLKSPTALTRPDFVAIILTGGDGGTGHQKGAQDLADKLGIRTAVLTKVPNQPLLDGKTEDVLLSYTLDQFRQSGDSSWPLLFPMVSSVVKGIDVLQGALEQKDLHVILIGASKRGWTTYLTAAVDKRVAAIVPTVFEMVSMEQQVALARERYGKDSEKIRPYTALGLTDSLKEPRLQQLISWIDPVSYFPRYTMPKLVLLGANDPYWVVDSVRKYWDKLPEPKLLRILPNVGHGVLGEDAASEAIASFVTLIMNNKPLPKASWSFSDPANGIALVRGQGDFQIARCSIWKAASESTDFRTALFSQSGCEVSQDKKSFKATVPVSGAENIALFADLEAERSSGDSKMVLSSESKVYLNQR